MGQFQQLGLGLRVYELGLWVMGQGQDLCFSGMRQGQGYELGLVFISQFQNLGFSVMSQGQGLLVRFRVYKLVLGLSVYDVGLGVMGQFYEFGTTVTDPSLQH